jgi:hypothetical protein
MAAQKATQFTVKLPGQTITLPSKPVDIADGAYFIWPLNLDLDGVNLRHATAQPVALLDQGKAGVMAVFAASAGIPVELAFDAALAPQIKGAQPVLADGHALVNVTQPGAQAALTVQREGKRPLTIVVLTPEQSQQLSVVQWAGQRRLLLSAQQSYVAGNALQLRSAGNSKFRFAVYPPLASLPKAASASAGGAAPTPPAAMLRATDSDGLFQVFEAELPARQPQATITAVRAAEEVGPVAIGGSARAAVQPAPEAFKAAAAWQVHIPREQLRGLDDALLQIDFVGDIGRLYSGTRMLDDWYYSGYQWQFGLLQAGANLDKPLTVSVLPLRADAPIYLPKEARPDFAGKQQAAELRKVSVIPVYSLRITP